MPAKAEKLTYEDIQKLFQIPTVELKETEMFLAGDHWQAQNGWVGWRPETTSETAVRDWQFIEGGFTPKNVIRGMVKRLQGAILGKEPDWDLVPAGTTPDFTIEPKVELTPEEKALKETDRILTEWWTEKRVHKALKRFIYNKAAYGKTAIRVYVPEGFVKENGEIMSLDLTNQNDLAEVLSKIHVEVPRFDSIIDAEDVEFGTEFTALGLKRDDSDEVFYELCYFDPETKKTYLRQVSQANAKPGDPTGANTEDMTVAVDLGGNLLVYVDGEYTDAMISRPVKQQQKQLNHANTMEGYAMANINFPPTYFTNAITEVETMVDGKRTPKTVGLLSGFGKYVNLIGVAIQRVDGSEDVKDPQITFQPTGKPEDFAKVAKNKAADMHEEAGMLYVFLADNPYPSGQSRIEAMTDYLILLTDYKTTSDNVGSWLLQTVLRLANNFLGKVDDNDKFTVTFDTKITVGRISTDDKANMLNEVKSNLRSRRSYMIAAEVTDDPMSEMRVIKAEEKLFPPPVLPTDPNKPQPKPASTPAPKPAPPAK